MLFNSPLFLFLFLPLAWGGFHLCIWLGHRVAIAWLVAASLLFYGWWTPLYLILLCLSIVINYLIGLLIQKTAEKTSLQVAILTCGVTANLLLLGYYKYLFPLLHWFAQFGIHLARADSSVILPLGISFFTFTQIAYLVDCKAGLTRGRRFLDYCLFVTFFPHLIAGPILHHREMMPQFEEKETWRFNLDNIAVGLSIFFIGLAKKTLIADFFALYASRIFDHPGGVDCSLAWESVLAYSMQLYFDFSGYSEMAIGLALLFNIRFPANFDSPYRSPSIIEFWQRWHMTLTRFLNLYLYNPLAVWITRYRTAKGLPIGRPALKTFSGFLTIVAFPTAFTTIVIGVWHGAGPQFVVFGFLHACYLIINHVWRLFTHKKKAPPLVGFALWFSTAWKVLLTYFAVLVAQIFFRASSVSSALLMLADMMGRPAPAYKLEIDMRPLGPALMLAFLVVWFAPNVLQIFAPWEPSLTKPQWAGPKWFQVLQWKPNLSWALVMGAVAALAILAITGQTEFLYFRF